LVTLSAKDIGVRRKGNPGSTTYSRNKQDKVIDGIWVTPGIIATRCGYTDPNSSPGGHSTFWADITYASALGHRLPDPISPEARRLELYDSKVTDKYLDKYEQLLQENRVCARQFNLEASATPGRPLNQAQCNEANIIDDLRTKCMKKVEKKCRHLHMGAVQFSLKTEQPCRRIRFWTLALRRRLKIKVNPSLWKRAKKKAKLEVMINTLSLTDIKAELTKARKDYHAAKRITKVTG